MAAPFLLIHGLMFLPSPGTILFLLTALVGLAALPALWFLRRSSANRRGRRRVPILPLVMIAAVGGATLTVLTSREGSPDFLVAPAAFALTVAEALSTIVPIASLAMLLGGTIFFLGVATSVWWIVDRIRGTPADSPPSSEPSPS